MNYTYYRRYQSTRRPRGHFKGFFWFVLVLVLLAIGVRACVGIFNGMAEERKDEAVLSIQKGSVELRSFGEENWHDAVDAQVFLEGDSVRTTESGWATLEFHNGTQLRLAQDSSVTFTQVDSENEDEFIVLELNEGRVWLDQVPNQEGELSIRILTEVIDMVALSGRALVTNAMNAESVYVFDGEVSVELVDRMANANDPLVIERFYLKEGTKTEFFLEDKLALLDRKDVTLYDSFDLEEFGQSDFLQWNLGNASIPTSVEEELPVEAEIESEEEDEEPEVIEEEPEEADEALKITIFSPSSGSTIEKDAIAIEGGVVSGEAARISVTWSGNGQAYNLGFFEAGNESFRYVADAAYGNFAVGENTYTIVAYDADGKASNTVSLTLTGNY